MVYKQKKSNIMRQIKFRGKDLNTGEWVYGFYSQGSFIDPINGEERVSHLIKGDALYDVDPETVGQFTGLLDLNGEEVYEGDIVMHDGNHELGMRIVVLYDQAFGIFTKGEYDDIRKGQNPWLNDYALPTCMNEWSVDGLLKVVGNIYDNDIIPEPKESDDERIRKASDENQGEQNPAWSEEDEMMFERILDIIGELGTEEMCKYWLKFLKERVQPQPKQEWSDRDKTIIESIEALCDEKIESVEFQDVKEHANDIKDWITDLKERYAWKPSDEQMEALEKECIAHSNYELCRLLEQLKKLREE